MQLPITITDVEAAAERIRRHVQRTPVLRIPALDERAGAELHLKAEHRQRTGAFKVRGAFNTLLQIPPAQRPNGVLAVSSGNHAQAVALAARELGSAATVVIPQDANPVKVAATRALGARVISDGVTADNREEIVRTLHRELGLPLVHPYDDPRIMAGQGTVGLELAADASGLDAVVVPVGGGGLLSGVVTAIKARHPRTRVIGVEPEAADDLARSMRAGRRLTLDRAPETVCDGVRAPSVGERPWSVISRLVDDVVTVTDAQALDAMHVLLDAGEIVEPSAALPLAAVLAGAVPGSRVGIVVSGGNVDPQLLRGPKNDSKTLS